MVPNRLEKPAIVVSEITGSVTGGSVVTTGGVVGITSVVGTSVVAGGSVVEGGEGVVGVRVNSPVVDVTVTTGEHIF